MNNHRFEHDRIIALANQIAENQHGLNDDQVADLVLTHINKFWHTTMKSTLCESDQSKLHPACQIVIQRLTSK